MTRVRRRTFAWLTAVALLAGCSGSAAPDTILMNAVVLTMNPAEPRAEAVAVREGRISAVGSSAEIRRLADARTLLVDLDGATLTPGFIDGHSHLLLDGQTGFSFVDVRPPPIGPSSDISSIQLALTLRDAQTPGEDPIIATGYDDTLLHERRHLNRADLDAVSTTRPIIVMHVSLHIAVANSLALSMAGITASTPQPEGGVIQMDPVTGEPNGVLEESSAMAPVFALLGAPPKSVSFRAAEIALDRYASQGVTTAQEGAADLDTLEVLFEMDMNRRLPIRVVALPRADAALAMIRGEVAADFSASDRLSMGPVKIVGDGSIQGYTGYLSQPYHEPFRGDTDYRGYPAMDREALAGLVDELYRGGFRVAIHGNGDAAIDDILHAFERAQQANPREADRPVVIHAQMARPDQLDWMARLNVIPSFFVLHTYYWGDRHAATFMGPERAARMSPTRSALDRGLHFTIHTDAPVVPMESMRLLWSAVNRTSTGGVTIGADERLTVEQALRAMTIDGAYQYQREDDLGSIEVGKLADLVVLSADPTAVDPAVIHEIEILRTMVDGETVWLR
jgi:hypothetical protein